MNKIIIVLLLCVLVAGCAQQASEQAKDKAGEQVNLVQSKNDSETTASQPHAELDEEPEQTTITEAEAKKIAIRQLEGIPKHVDTATKFGKEVYVVTVNTPSGNNIDVLVDIHTGEIVGME